MTPRVPCRDCSNRVLGCHSYCEEYTAYKLELDRLREVDRIDKDILDLKVKNVERTKKRYNR